VGYNIVIDITGDCYMLWRTK